MDLREHRVSQRSDRAFAGFGDQKIKLCCDGSTVYDGREIRPHSVTGFLIPIVRLRIEPFHLENDTIADLRLVMPLNPNISIPESLTGRLISHKTTTVEQFKFWLKDCLKSHEHTDSAELPDHPHTERYIESLDSIPEFTLIDVSSRALVTLSALKRVDRTYIALSYVWGPDAPKITPGPDGKLPAKLPATIEDALTLVSSLGFVPFLWIDSICIPQDNTAVRLAQIQRMDVIYHRAIATIIATGPSVHSGLTGISTNNNPSQSLQLSPYLLTYQAAPWKHLMSGFNDAASRFLPWGSRGWTFQEALLSRRRLILNNANDRIMFECNVGSRQTHPTDAFEQIKAGFFNDLDRIRGTNMEGWNIHWYQHLLNLYLQRSLSYEKDVVGAFMGVARMIARAVEKREGKGLTCWTIPRRDFVAGLMWAPTRKCKEVLYRKERLGPEGVLDDGRKLPTWHFSSLIMKEGVAFVQGSEPLQLYEGCRNAWTKDWDDEVWDEVERTGRVDFKGEVIDFEAEGTIKTVPHISAVEGQRDASDLEASTQHSPKSKLSLFKTTNPLLTRVRTPSKHSAAKKEASSAVQHGHGQGRYKKSASRWRCSK